MIMEFAIEIIKKVEPYLINIIMVSVISSFSDEYTFLIYYVSFDMSSTYFSPPLYLLVLTIIRNVVIVFSFKLFFIFMFFDSNL